MPGHEAESDRHQIHNTQTPSIHYFRFFCLTSPSLQKLQFGPGCTKQNLWWSMPCPTNNIKALKGIRRCDPGQRKSSTGLILFWSAKWFLRSGKSNSFVVVLSTPVSHGSVSLPACKRLAIQVNRRWQQRWNRSGTGRATHSFIPQVGRKSFLPRDRCIAVSYIRLLLDDTTLNDHMQRSGFADSRQCDWGLGVEDAFHL